MLSSRDIELRSRCGFVDGLSSRASRASLSFLLENDLDVLFYNDIDLGICMMALE